jgi:hypothetical protein
MRPHQMSFPDSKTCPNSNINSAVGTRVLIASLDEAAFSILVCMRKSAKHSLW